MPMLGVVMGVRQSRHDSRGANLLRGDLTVLAGCVAAAGVRETMSTEPPIAVVGAGLVGTTAAIYLAREGYNVHLYEGRDDLRLEAKHDESRCATRGAVLCAICVHAGGCSGRSPCGGGCPRRSPFGASTSPTARSINLALSKRGIDTFDAIGLKDIVLSNVIQMKCRAMHAFDGSLSYMPYGTGSQHINSVSRNFLNHLLLDEAEKLPNVTIFFNAKVTRVSKAGTLTVDFKKAGQTKRVPTRLVIGADGAFSSVRSSMMRLMRVDFSQHFIEHGYKELTMPPVRRPDGSMGYAIDPVNALHIWPRHEYMMIALPNPDKRCVWALGLACATLGTHIRVDAQLHVHSVCPVRHSGGFGQAPGAGGGVVRSPIPRRGPGHPRSAGAVQSQPHRCASDSPRRAVALRG